MAESQVFKDTLEKLIQSWEIYVYIRDSNNEWVDFSERLEVNGRDLLLSLGAVTHSTEDIAGVGSFYTRIGSVKLSNAPESATTYGVPSGYFDQRFPTTLKTIYGNIASFPPSEDSRYSVIYHHQLKVGIRLHLKDGGVEQGDLGVFLIDGVKSDGEVLTLKLVGLQKKFMDVDASVVKDGLGFYTNRSYSFLIRKLIERVEEDATVPSTYTLPDMIQARTADGDRILSHFGRPPEWDGTNWLEEGYTCRALVWGDLGNDPKLYLGCDEVVYEYDPSTDTYTEIADMVDDLSLASGTYVRKLWYNSNYGANAERLWGVAWADATTSSRTVTMKVFSVKISSGEVVTATLEKSIASVFPGDFSYREGEYVADVGTGVFGDIIGTSHGNNVPLSFDQVVRYINKAGIDAVGYDIESTLESNDNGGGVAGTLDLQIDSGYCSFVATHGDTAEHVNIGLRFSFGQEGIITFNPEYDWDPGGGASDKKGAILYCAMIGLAYYYYIYDIANDALREVQADYTISGLLAQPTCACAEPDDDFLVGIMCMDETGDDNESYSYIAGMSPPTNGVAAGVATIYQSAGDSVSIYRTFLEMIYNASDDEEIHVVTFRRDKLGTGEAYEIATYGKADADSELVIKDTSGNQFKGLVVDAVNSDTWCVECGSNRLMQFDISEDTVAAVDDGYTIVEGESNLSSNLVVVPHGSAVAPLSGISGLDLLTRTEDVIFGCSAPDYPAETQIAAPAGKYYLWKYDMYFANRVELADFEGLSVWNAMGLFAQASDSLMGFETDGDFFFVARKESGSADYILTCDADHQRLAMVEKDWGYGEIYNHCRIVPYRVHMEEPDATLVAIEPPKGTFKDAGGEDEDRPKPLAWYVKQGDGTKKSIRLICEKEGKVNSSTDYPLFKWLCYFSIIETQFSASVGSADTTLSLLSVFGGGSEGVEVGDFIVVQDESDGSDIVRAITAVSTSANTIDIQASLGVSFAKGDVVRIMKAHQTEAGTRREWSDEGVTYIVDHVDNTAALFQVTSVRHLEAGVLVEVNGEREHIKSAYVNDSDEHWVELDAVLPAGEPSAGDLVKAFFAPDAVGEYFPIGGTNVSIKFEIPTSGTEDKNWTARFFKGDIFDVKCQGLVLDSNEQSAQVVYDSSSVSRHGKKEYKGLDNRFVGVRLARHLARRVVTKFAEPKFILKVKGIFLSYLTFLTSTGTQLLLGVRHRTMFPTEKSHQIDGYVRSIRHGPVEGVSEFVIRQI